MSINRYLTTSIKQTSLTNNSVAETKEPISAERLQSNRGFNQYLLGSTKANAITTASTGTIVVDTESRNGWLYTNPVLGNALDVLIFDGTHENLKIKDIRTLFLECSLDKINSSKSVPQITIYTKPTGVGDLDPTYHATLTFKYNDAGAYRLGEGEEINLCSNGSPVTFGMDMSSRLILFETTSSNNNPQQSEDIAFIRIKTDSTAPANEVAIRLISSGFEAIDKSNSLKPTSRRIKFLGTDVQKVDINMAEEGISTEAKQDDQITKLDSIDGKISKGNSATGVGDELQQVLIYGKKPDGTLQPLETVDDRLLVDVVELAAAGQITNSTALASVQVCGYDTGTSKFKTVNVDGSGNVQCDIVSGTVTATVSSAVIKANDGNDGSGTDRTVKCDGNGALIVDPSKEAIVTSNGTTQALHCMMMGTNDNVNLRTVKVGDGGAINTEQDHSWDATNQIFNAVSVVDGDTVESSTFDLGTGVSHEIGKVEFFLDNSATVDIEVKGLTSYNGTDFYNSGSAFSVVSSDEKIYFSQEDVGIGSGHRYMRLTVTNNNGLGTSTNISTQVGYYK